MPSATVQNVRMIDIVELVVYLVTEAIFMYTELVT